MLVFMLGMYANGVIFIGAAVVFAAALYLVRSQATVDDIDYMKAMIPHHSIAILTSERAGIADPRVRAARGRDHRGAAARNRRDAGPA